MEKCLKRYPVLVPGATAPILRAMAKLPPGEVSWEEGTERVLPELRQAALDSATRAATAKDPGVVVGGKGGRGR